MKTTMTIAARVRALKRKDADAQLRSESTSETETNRGVMTMRKTKTTTTAKTRTNGKKPGPLLRAIVIHDVHLAGSLRVENSKENGKAAARTGLCRDPKHAVIILETTKFVLSTKTWSKTYAFTR